MEDGLLYLKWNNHRNTFFNVLSDLRYHEVYTDATIACEANYYSVHKLVLAACSEYFNEVFQKTPCKTPVVILKDIRPHDLEILLTYMYVGEVNVKQSSLDNVMKAAECLRIKGLTVPENEPVKVCNKRPMTSQNLYNPPTKRARKIPMKRSKQVAPKKKVKPPIKKPTEVNDRGTTQLSDGQGEILKDPKEILSTIIGNESMDEEQPEIDVPTIKEEPLDDVPVNSYDQNEEKTTVDDQKAMEKDPLSDFNDVVKKEYDLELPNTSHSSEVSTSNSDKPDGVYQSPHVDDHSPEGSDVKSGSVEIVTLNNRRSIRKYYIHNDYIFYCNRKVENRLYLRCVRNKEGCQSTAVIEFDGSKITLQEFGRYDHNHQPSFSFADNLRLKKICFDRSFNESEGFRAIYDAEITKFPLADTPFELLKTPMRRCRTRRLGMNCWNAE